MTAPTELTAPLVHGDARRSFVVSWTGLAVVSSLLSVLLTMAVPTDTLYTVEIDLGVGGLKITDLLLMATFVAWLLAMRTENRARTLPDRSLSALILGLIALGLLGVGTALRFHVVPREALFELRPLLAYLLVFPLVSLVAKRSHLWWGVAAVAAVGVVSAIVITALYLAGAGDDATYSGGAIRVMSVPFTAPTVGVLVATALLPFARTRREALIVASTLAICAMGVYFTLQRGAFVGIAVGVVIAVVCAPPKRRVRLALALVVALGVGTLGVATFGAISGSGGVGSLTSGASRMESIFAGGDDASSQHRINEWHEAWRRIRQHPVAGIGLGNTITFHSPMYNPATYKMGYTATERYIHNSYIWAALKLGPLAALVLVGIIARVLLLAVGVRRSSGATPEEHAAASVVLAVVSGMAVVALTGPHLTVATATGIMAGIIAMSEIVRRQTVVQSPAPEVGPELPEEAAKT